MRLFSTMPKIYYWLMLVAVLYMGCEKRRQARWRTLAIEKLYTLDLPVSFVPSNEMHESAPLQYMDTEKDYYVVGLSESKEHIKAVKGEIKLDDYYKMVEDTITSGAVYKRYLQGERIKGEELKMKIGDYEIEKEMMGKNYHLLYRIAVAESPKNFFQIVLYRPYTDSCNVYPLLDSITHSLKALPQEDRS